MTPAERIHVYVGEPLRRLLDSRGPAESGPGASALINAAVDRYQQIVARSLPALSEAEWMAIADALNGVALGIQGHDPIPTVWLEIADADRLDGLGDKWSIDAQALARRLHDAPYAEVAALVDVVERLWSQPGADWPATLRAWGVLPDDTVPRTGESTETLREDQVETLVDLVRADRRTDYDTLCAALGVTNGATLWRGIQRRVHPPEESSHDA